MRAGAKPVVLVVTALLLLSAVGCASGGSSDSPKTGMPATTTAPTNATAPTTTAQVSPDLSACGVGGYGASLDITDGTIWLKVVDLAAALEASDTVVDALRKVATSYAENDTAGASKALENLFTVCKPYA